MRPWHETPPPTTAMGLAGHTEARAGWVETGDTDNKDANNKHLKQDEGWGVWVQCLWIVLSLSFSLYVPFRKHSSLKY